MTEPEDDAPEEQEPAVEPGETSDETPAEPPRLTPTLAERRAEAMRLTSQPAAELAAHIEEQTKGYRELSERIAKSVQPALDTQEQIRKATGHLGTGSFLPKVDLSFATAKHVEHVKPVASPRLTRFLEEIQEHQAAAAAELEREQEEWEQEQELLAVEFAEERRRRDELEAQRHDAMLSALTQTVGHVENTAVRVGELLEEQRSTHGLGVVTVLLAYLSVSAPLLMAIWDDLKDREQISAAIVSTLVAVLLLLIFGRRPSRR